MTWPTGTTACWRRSMGTMCGHLSEQPAQARIPLGWPDLPGRSWRLTDILGRGTFERNGGELASPGLFVDLGPWQFHLLAMH
jgi:hypothetical protein